ncbi:hypothetical protein RchiOBHm_Chr2g0134591 [Rosa chinensis]|uniref:Uncharacterized protein n=1 Tax=Rosa chinensis TaxID=74649 RepID=A0A2P6RVV6_ROSCH|nr:hypothetical protein RchiOBHm_Chr2g0134591 [Rosa chinensis]
MMLEFCSAYSCCCLRRSRARMGKDPLAFVEEKQCGMWMATILEPMKLFTDPEEEEWLYWRRSLGATEAAVAVAAAIFYPV